MLVLRKILPKRSRSGSSFFFPFFPPFFLSFVHVRAYIYTHARTHTHMHMHTRALWTPVCARVPIHTHLRDPFLLSSFLPTVCVNACNLSLFSLTYARIYIHVFILISIVHYILSFTIIPHFFPLFFSSRLFTVRFLG